MQRPRRLLASALAALALSACAASLGEAHPCPDAACAEGRSCVAGRCRPQDVAPAPGDTLRVVLLPTDLAVVAAHGGGGGGPELPDTVALGRSASGTVVMLFRFAATWREDAEVTSAFLVLDPLEGAPPALGAITFEMARVVEPWEPALVTRGRQPRLAVPLVAGAQRGRAPLPLRVDVTPLVRDWQRRDPQDHGIALLASGDDAYGTVISLGVSLGRGPRLEVYVR